LYRSLKNKDGEGGSTLFWRGLNDDDRNILSEGGWDEGGYNDNGGASKADLLHDPLTYLETAVVGSGFIHAGLSLWGVVITGGPAVTSTGYDPAKTVSDIAQQVADNTGGILDPAKGNGWKVTLQGAAEGNNIVARIMVSGGGRLEPYYRVAVQNVGAVTSNGQFSSDQQLTHHLINLINPAETVNNIVNLIQGLIE
jgi:hypothetical protein